jgi:Bacterial TniB protein
MSYDNFDPTAYLRQMLTEAEREFAETVEDIKGLHVESNRDDVFDGNVKRIVDNASKRRNPGLPHAANNRRPGMAIMLTGPSGSGKTSTAQNCFLDNAAFPNYGSAAEWCPLIFVGAPAPCTLLQLAMRILTRLGYNSTRELRENGAWLRVRLQLQEQKILFLAIDDFQHVLHQCNEFEIQKVRDTLKDLMTSPDWPMQLILIGMPELIPFAKADPQLRRRIRYMKLEPVSPKSDFEFLDATIRNYAEKAGLKFGIEDKDALVGRLCHAAGYQMGIAIEIVTEAIEHALGRGSKVLELVDFEEAYAARNLQPNDQNPFFADAWDTIDVTLLRPRSEDPEDDRPVDPTPKKRRSKRSR